MDAVIRQVDTLDAAALEPLLTESLSEGYRFIQTLLDEYVSGVHRFDTPEAVLLGAYRGERLIGIGGVLQDPYLKRPDTGRVRHVYVLREFRRYGVGKLLLDALIAHARQHFEALTLRMSNHAAGAFYEAIGFITESLPPEATHWMPLKRE